MPTTLAPAKELSTTETPSATLGRADASPAVHLSRSMGGAITLAALSLGFFSLPWVAWVLTGEWVPEMLVFGLGAVIVGVVAQHR